MTHIIIGLERKCCVVVELVQSANGSKVHFLESKGSYTGGVTRNIGMSLTVKRRQPHRLKVVVSFSMVHSYAHLFRVLLVSSGLTSKVNKHALDCSLTKITLSQSVKN